MLSKAVRSIPHLLGIALCFLCLTRADGSPVSKEARECFEWFGTLGFPDVENAPWAEVWTGSYVGSVPPKARTLQGFITKSDGDKLTVLTEGLIPLSLSKSKPDTDALEGAVLAAAANASNEWFLQEDKREPLRSGLASKTPDAAAMDVAESLLAHALEDIAARTGTGGSYGDYRYSNPRICDFALWALHRILPDRYVFSAVAEEAERDIERIR